MDMSPLKLIWANKPGCRRAVTENWIGEKDLLFTIFADDSDSALKIEMLPSKAERAGHFFKFADPECLLERANGELRALIASSSLRQSAVSINASGSPREGT